MVLKVVVEVIIGSLFCISKSLSSSVEYEQEAKGNLSGGYDGSNRGCNSRVSSRAWDGSQRGNFGPFLRMVCPFSSSLFSGSNVDNDNEKGTNVVVIVVVASDSNNDGITNT